MDGPIETKMIINSPVDLTKLTNLNIGTVKLIQI